MRRSGPKHATAKPDRMPIISGDETHISSGKFAVAAFGQRHFILFIFFASFLYYALSRTIFERFQTQSKESPVSNVITQCSKARDGLGLDGIESSCPTEVVRILEYCNAGTSTQPGYEGRTSSSGRNNFYSSSRFEMIHLALLIRHGDRSAISAIPGSINDAPDSTTTLQNAKADNIYLDPRALNYKLKLHNYVLKMLPASEARAASLLPKLLDEAVRVGPDLRPMSDALNPAAIFKTPDLHLPPGQLTTRGFMQHVHLGSALAQAYQPFLQKHVVTPSNVFVRSTNYNRTIQSAAALLLGMLPDLGGSDHPIIINAFDSEVVEVMHGVSHGATGACNAAVKAAKQEKDLFQLPKNILERLQELFAQVPAGSSSVESSRSIRPGLVQKSFITDITDAALPKLCHNLPLPCGQTPTQCMTEEDLGLLMWQADRAFCNRYAGSNGGRDSTKINAFPFLNEIMDVLTVAGKKNYEKGSGDNAGKDQLISSKLSVFSGHDTVIAPVLEGLGLYKGQHCGWPRYAARIAFELWHKFDSSISDKNREQLYVRVIYNGEDLTGAIPACEGNVPCPLESLRAAIQGLLQPATSLREACEYVV